MIILRSLLVLCAVVSASCAQLAPQVKPESAPKLSDALAVAKSPLEPVTLALTLPGARNDDLPTTGVFSSQADKIETFVEHRQSTRAVQLDEQERGKTTIDMEPSLVQSTRAESLETSTAVTDAIETESTTPSTEPELDTAVTRDLTRLPTVESTEATSTTTTTPTTESKVSSEQPDDSSDKLLTTQAPQLSTTPDEPGTTAEEPKVTTEKSSLENSSETEAPSSTSSTPRVETESIGFSEKEVETTTPASVTPLSNSIIVTDATSTTVSPASSTPKPTSTAAPAEPEREKEKEIDNKKVVNEKSACNHLPTYESDEIQKVFREETTYKNGTIKGKFTYINFDQRYRLVHYTRLPYGPVKIDLVEELGKPEASNNQSVPQGSNDIPNAVLQLRNILPNSLFGFPFLGPNSANNKPSEQKEGLDNQKSNQYFYSTDSISTPNLLTPNVPVSLLPGQSKVPQPVNGPAADTLSQSYFQNLHVPSQIKQEGKIAPQAAVETLNHHQFQYALASSQAGSPPDSKQQGFMYSYLAQPQMHYQYSPPLPLYSFQPPSFYTQRQPLVGQTTSYSAKVKHEQTSLEPTTTIISHQTHQPHSHEHYMAPFMYVQPPESRSDQAEASKLRLRVKSAKALADHGTKSAQLRAPSYTSYQSPIASPASSHRPQRQRAGKQNQDLKTSPVNTSPVVYHVLRSPVGRMYTLPQFNQAYAMAYDHDD